MQQPFERALRLDDACRVHGATQQVRRHVAAKSDLPTGVAAVPFSISRKYRALVRRDAVRISERAVRFYGAARADPV